MFLDEKNFAPPMWNPADAPGINNSPGETERGVKYFEVLLKQV